MTAIDRGVDVIADIYPCVVEDEQFDIIRTEVQALAAAGLLVTDEMRAVLNAAVELVRVDRYDGRNFGTALMVLTRANDAYVASREPWGASS